MRFTTGRDRILIPTEATAGTKLVVTDEEAGYDENEPVFGQAALTIYKFTKMLKISEELMDGDSVGLEKYLASTLARAQAKAENYYCTVGTGSSMPQGLVYASTSSAVMMATSDVIVSTDITGARGVLNAGWDVPGEVGVVMAPSVWWYIKGIAGSDFQFVNTPAGGDMNLFGERVYLAPDCDALTVHSGKVITWANFGAYAFAERQGLTVARNPYLYQANGIVGVFAKARFGAVLTQALATVHMLGHND
jgi:HK97 family phage major capsid protein